MNDTPHDGDYSLLRVEVAWLGAKACVLVLRTDGRYQPAVCVVSGLVERKVGRGCACRHEAPT